MIDATHERPSGIRRGGRRGYAMAGGALLAACLLGLIAALALAGGSHHAQANARASGGGAPASRTHSAGAGRQGAVSGVRVQVDEPADPEEASSYPAPASVHHSAAIAPATAGKQIVAPGAASDAEVRAELRQTEAAEHDAARTQAAQLTTPVPGGESIGGNGTIPIPEGVPEVVQRVIAGANAIADFPYVFGGGHASFVDDAYDCSGSVSYALAAGGLLSAPETSGELESWGVPGPGKYITVFANAGHTYMYVDGILYDTAGRSGVLASRWQVGAVDNAGFIERHYPAL